MTNSTTFPGTVTASGFTGTSTNATNAVLATDATNASRPVIFGTATTGNVPLKTDPGLVYNPSSNKLTAGAFVGDGSELTGISAGFDPDVDTIKIGNGAGTTTQGANAIAIGHDAGSSGTQGANSVAVGWWAGQATQGEGSIAVGPQAGKASQGNYSVAMGYQAGVNAQGDYGIAIGETAGGADQGAKSVAMGYRAAYATQGPDATAVGSSAGYNAQGTSATAVGNFAGCSSQGAQGVAIGESAARSGQGTFATAMGYYSGYNAQGAHSVAIGDRCGSASQGTQAVAIGYQAGYNAQGVQAVAIGREAGNASQLGFAVAVGYFAGRTAQGYYGTAVGAFAGSNGQGNYATALGLHSAYTNQGTYSIAIGYAAGFTNQPATSIVINGSGSSSVNPTATSQFHVAPVRNYGALSYSSSNGEIYGNSSDDRVKHNESYIKNALKTIMKLKPQTYDKCKNLESNTYVEMHESGFMAQDIWYDVPEMKHIVILAPTANPTPEKPPAPSDDPRDDPDYSAWGADLSTLNYTQVIPFLTKAVQEISVEVPRAKTTVSNTWGQNITGLVVSANTNKHKTNTVPIVNLSTVSMDKSWYGVVSNEKTDSIEYDTLVDIKGDSRIWVTDMGGTLESGDLLTTSNVAPGYTQKQEGGALMNYTVAKVTQDCDFTEPSTITLKVPKQELSNVTYYVHQEKYRIDKDDYDILGQPRDKMSEVVTAYRKSEDDDILTTLSQRMYDDLLGEQKRHYTAFEKIEYSRLDRYESKYQNDAYKNKHTIEEIRQELIDVLDENGQTVWEETGETQPVYTLVDHGTYKAALVTCKLI